MFTRFQLFREFGHVEHWLWKLEALTLHSQSSAFVVLEHCFRCARAMLLPSKSYALGVLKQCFRRLKDMLSASWRMCCFFQSFTNILKTSFAPSKKTVTGHRCDHVSSRPQNGHRSQVWPCYLSTTRGKWKPKMQNVSKKIICFTICYKTANILIKMSNPNGHTIWIQNDKEYSNI